MTDANDGVSAPVATELKSTDTRVIVEVKPEPAKVEAAEPVEAKDPEGVATPDAPDADSPQGKEKRLPRWMKERLERERQVTEARTEARLREEFARQAPPEKVEPVKPEKADKTLEDFDFDQDAFLEWKLERKLEEREKKQQAQEQERKHAEAAETFKKRIDSFEERAGDGAWEDIQTSKLNTDPAYMPLVSLIQGHDFDLDIAHHLATHPKEAAALLELHPLRMAAEINKIAERFGGEQVERPAPMLPKKTTNAPPPPKTVSGAGKPSVDVNAPDLTPEQRIAMWRKKS